MKVVELLNALARFPGHAVVTLEQVGERIVLFAEHEGQKLEADIDAIGLIPELVRRARQEELARRRAIGLKADPDEQGHVVGAVKVDPETPPGTAAPAAPPTAGELGDTAQSGASGPAEAPSDPNARVDETGINEGRPSPAEDVGA
jgi:hypothetical protein